ncbi:MAG: aminodeoxychorismate lyase [Woeseiaceae bacterium]
MSNWFSAGRSIDSIAVDDRSAHYGDGVFETIAIRDGAARFWSLHNARLQTACSRLGITCPAEETLHDELENAIEQSPTLAEFGTAKLIVSAGSGPRGYRRGAETQSDVRIGMFSAQHIPADTYKNGVAVRICSTRLAMQPQLAGIKSMNRLEQVLACAEWSDAEIFEGLMLDTADRLICGTMSNMFIVTASGLATPALTRCGVSGVMRRHLLGVMDEEGIECDVRDIDLAELDSADEIFLSNSQFGVLPVRACAQRQWKSGALTKRVQQLAAANGVPECAP